MSIRDNKQLTKIVAASLLGDAHLSWDKRSKNGNSGFVLTQILPHKDYLAYIQSYLETLTTTNLSKARDAVDDVTILGVRTSQQETWKLLSRLHPFYTKFRERMYPNGHKVVDPHYLTLIDAQFLANWIQEDGWLSASLHKGKHIQYHLEIASQSFSYADNMLLRKALKERLDLDFNVTQFTIKSGLKYRLRASAKDIDKIIQLVEPYIVPSFMYKIDKEGQKKRIEARMSSSVSDITDGDMIQSL